MQMLFWRKNHRVGSLRRETKSKNSTQKRNLKAKEHAPEGQTLKIYRVVPKTYVQSRETIPLIINIVFGIFSDSVIWTSEATFSEYKHIVVRKL
jgi:hypothetical protein